MNFLLVVIALLQAPVAGGGVRGAVLTGGAEPVYDARVELVSPMGPLVTRTDREGRFGFSGLAPGAYRLSVKKEGFVRQEWGQRKPGGAGTLIAVDPGKTAAEIVIRLQPAGTIAGEVRNEDGIPVANILVQALRQSYNARGKRIFTLFSSTLTDDLGAYRLFWIDPGDYYVNASYLPQLPTPINPNEDAPRAFYAPTFFPGTPDPLQAQLVHVESTGGRAIGLKLQRSPAVSVSGTIRTVLTGAGTRATVTLMAPEESGSTARYSRQTDGKGVFEMNGVTAGTYVLAAKSLSGDGQIGYSRIEVLDIDRPRADVVVGPGVSIGVRMFGEAPPALDLRSMRVSLLPVETYFSPASSVVLPNGVVTLANVQPGEYVLAVSGIPDNGYVKAARSGLRDVLEESVIVQYDNVQPLDIQLAFDGGQITGFASDAAGQPVDDATVVLVPDPALRHRPDLYRAVSSAADGKFSINNIPPGDYKLFAWDSIEPNAWLNRDFMQNYEQLGVADNVGAGAKISAQIRVIRSAQ